MPAPVPLVPSRKNTEVRAASEPGSSGPSAPASMNDERHRRRPGSGRDGRPSGEIIQLRDVWNLLSRNKWLILGFLTVAVGLAAAYTVTRVPVWDARVSIRIEEERSSMPVLDVLQTISQGSQVETEMEVLRSRTLAKEVVDSLNLQLQVTEPRGRARTELLDRIHVERWAPSSEYRLERTSQDRYRVLDLTEGGEAGTVGTEEAAVLPGVTFTLTPGALEHDLLEIRVQGFDRTVSQLQTTMGVNRPNRDAGIVVARYESADTQLVHRVPNLLAELFISRRLQVQKIEATSTVAFLNEQIDTLRLQLNAAEEALTRFREGEQVVNLQAESQAQVTQLARLQAERNQLDAERAALQELLDEIQQAEEADPVARGEPSPYRRLIAFPSLLRNQAASELLRSLNEIGDERADLLRRRTTEDPDVVALTNRIEELEEQLRSIATTYLEGLTNQVNSLDETLERFGSELSRIPGKELQLLRLQRQQTVLEEIYTLLQTRLQEAQIAEAVEDPSVRIVDRAELFDQPIRPRPVVNVSVGLILGLILGVGAAFTREYMDDTVHTREDMQGATRGAPVLGMIPRIREAGWKNGGRKPSRTTAKENGVGHLESRLVTGRDPRNPVSEAYRSLRTNITFANPDEPPKTLVFTSPMPQEGKSTSAANLAITLVQQGIRAVLIDADLRRGVLHSVFKVPREPGLTNVLTDQSSLKESLRTLDLGESGRMDFLASGTLPPNPSELLGSEKMKSMLQALEDEYEAVILDSAPLNVVTDAAVLGTKADGVVLIARASVTDRGAVHYAVEQLENVRAPILGSVLNDVDYRRDGRYSSKYGKYGYYYQYYYGETKES